ncbi:MAG: sulfotransferase [Saprospiraceae bacterium]|nr:sulfotransferase [Saprospiraceae bacterium]
MSKLRILIGGSGSTGSSLLKNILSRHSSVFAGNETSLFTKKKLYEDFTGHKKHILKRFPQGIRSHSYHMYNGVDLVSEEYGHTTSSLIELINKSSDFQSFADGFFENGIDRFGKTHWLEKTPGNAFLFKEFLNSFENSKTIHLTRNPLDTIYSLIRRGFNLVESCGIYLLNTASALRAKDYDDHYQLKYEDLITHPEATVKRLLNFLDLPFESKVLESGNPYGIIETKIDSWRYDETSSVHRNIQEIPESTLSNIMQAISVIKVSEQGSNLFNSIEHDFQTLLSSLDYEFHEVQIEIKTLNLIKRQMRLDRWKRMKKFYQTGFYYPLAIKK